MTTLALDLGTRTGWAIKCGENGPVVSGTQSFAPNRYEGGGMRFLRFRSWLNELYETNSLERIYFEEVRRHVGTDAAHVYGGLMATLTAWCEELHIPYAGVPVGTIKKHATGRGNASKIEMIHSAKERGHTPRDDNEADAIALLYWVLDEMGD